MINFKEVEDKTLQNGEHTVEETGRYIVGLEGYEVIVPIEEFNEDVLYNYFMDTLPDKHNVTMGTWVHEGNVYIDTSVGYDNLEDALIAGELNKQIAIYDTKEELEVIVA